MQFNILIKRKLIYLKMQTIIFKNGILYIYKTQFDILKKCRLIYLKNANKYIKKSQ